MTQADKRQAKLEARNAQMVAKQAAKQIEALRQETARVESSTEQARQEIAAGRSLRFSALNVELVNGIVYATSKLGSLNGKPLPGRGVRLGPIQGASARVTRQAPRVAKAGVAAQLVFMASPSRKVPRASITVTVAGNVLGYGQEGNILIKRAIANAEKFNLIATGL
jgi:hypothetical protein